MLGYRGLVIGAVIGALAGGGAIYLDLRPLPSGDQNNPQGGLAMEAVSPRTGTQVLSVRSSGESENLETLRRQVRDLQAAVASLRDELGRVEARRAARPAAGHRDRPNQVDWDEPASAPNRSWEEEAEVARRELQRHFDGLEAEHRNEYQDPAWSAAAVAQIETALFQEEGLAGLEVYDLDCRTTRCRFEIWFDEETDIDDVEMALAGSVADAPRMAIHYVEDSADGAMQRAVVYVGREDADFAGQ